MTNSPEEGLDCAEVFPELPVAVVPHAIEIPECKAPMEVGGNLRLLYLGRLDPIKGIDILIRAVSLLRERNAALRWELKIAGSGDTQYEQTLKELIVSLDLSQNVLFTGLVAGAPKERLFRESHVVVVPSHSENFCAVVGESLALGRPVITTTGVPWDGVAKHGCGLRVAVTPKALCDAIIRISGCDLQLMGLAGRNWVSEEFSTERISAIWNDLLSTQCAPSSQSGSSL